MPNNLHIMITTEKDSTRSFVIPVPVLKIASITTCLVLCSLFVLSSAGIYFSLQNASLKSSVAQLEADLDKAESWNSEFESQVNQELAQKEQNLQETLGELRERNSQKEEMLNNALEELQTKSRLMESILTTVGLKVEESSSGENSGGPFIPLSDEHLDDLASKADSYIEALRAIPLGAPVWGEITSMYGRRGDPINHQPAFHSGIDIREKTGTAISAPADGIVIDKGYTKGHGNYLVLQHGLGFKTRYLHMKKSLVGRGEEVVRGQTIGLVGNTGRSTGPHLHYEIFRNEKFLNPLKYIRYARYLPDND